MVSTWKAKAVATVHFVYFHLSRHPEDDGSWTELVKVLKDSDKTRLNDSTVDCKGRLWFGSLDIYLDESDLKRPDLPRGYHATGSLWRLDPDQTLHVIQDQGLVCSNGIGWTSDNKVMFHPDSFRQIIWAYDYDLSSGDISNKRIYIDRRGQDGEPDGLIVDHDENVFTCIWDGSYVEKYNLGGHLVQRWKLNTTRPTHGTWFGENMNEIIVTSAKKDTVEGDMEDGGLFWLKNVTTSQGLPKGEFDLQLSS